MTLSPIDTLRLVHSFLAIMRNPRSLDRVLDLSDRIADSEDAEALLAESRPALLEAAEAVRHLDPPPPLDLLRELPDGTLGREYARFMDDNGLVPEALREVAGDTNLAHLRATMRRSHDIWHVATGWTPDLLGELSLQAFYLAQLRVPFPAFILAAGLLHTVLKQRGHFFEIVDAVAEGWRQGTEADALVRVDWNLLMDQPVPAVQDTLRIAPARRRPYPVVPLVA